MKKRLSLDAATWIVAALAMFVGGLRLYSYLVSRATASPPSPTVVEDWRKYAMGGHRDGPPSAAVTIVEFADFQCGYCRQAFGVLKGIRAEFPNDVAIVFRHFPLPSHPFALGAAVASECAARAGRFWEFHDVLFREFDSLGVKRWKRFGADAGIADVELFSACVSDSSTLAIVGRDREAATEVGVNGTPTFLINGLKVVGFPGRERLVEYVQEALDGGH